MIRHLIFLSLGLLLLLSVSVSRAAIIVNGSFETPDIADGTFVNFPSGSTAITGWTVVGVDSAITDSAFVQSGITFQAQDGRQWLDLAGVTSNSMTSGVTQNVATTVSQAYTLSFFVGSATDSNYFFPSTIRLSIDGGPTTSYTNPNAPTNMLDWMNFTATFVATSATTSITFLNGSASNNYLSALDNVTIADAPVAAVPEPTSLALWGITALAVGLVSRRRLARW